MCIGRPIFHSLGWQGISSGVIKQTPNPNSDHMACGDLFPSYHCVLRWKSVDWKEQNNTFCHNGWDPFNEDSMLLIPKTHAHSLPDGDISELGTMGGAEDHLPGNSIIPPPSVGWLSTSNVVLNSPLPYSWFLEVFLENTWFAFF